MTPRRADHRVERIVHPWATPSPNQMYRCFSEMTSPPDTSCMCMHVHGQLPILIDGVMLNYLLGSCDRARADAIIARLAALGSGQIVAEVRPAAL